MDFTAPVCQETQIPASLLEKYAPHWLVDCEYRQLSPGTVQEYRDWLRRFLWFLATREIAAVGKGELRSFLAHVARGHLEPDGRWGSGARGPVSNRTLQSYFERGRTYFRWLLAEGVIPHSPMEALRPPLVRPSQIQPFSREQQEALRAAARRTRNPRRDEALILFLLDTGARASEVCRLRLEDLDLTGRSALLMGKGSKQRRVYLGRATGRALWMYLRDREEESGPLFLSQRGAAFTRWGLGQLVQRLGRAAHIEAVRCSPHTWRHTMALAWLQQGGDVFSLKELLGHSSLAMCNRYVKLAQADLQQQHARFSPADRLRRK